MKYAVFANDPNRTWLGTHLTREQAENNRKEFERNEHCDAYIEKEYEEGDVLCDMHDRFRDLPEGFEVTSHIKLRTDNAYEMVINAIGKHPGNKYLVIADVSLGVYTAIYSYDGRYFGMVELKHKKQN